MDGMNDETKPRGPLAQALKQLDDERALRLDCARELEHAAQFRAGLMDSESRQAEVQREMQRVLTSVAQRLRGVQ
jgi:hypothetical protein